jgi:hypothetical protein
VFESDDAFWKSFERLNALNGEGWRREPTTARTRHIDLFGDTINKCEIYFKKEYGSAFASVVKLSRASMERALFAVVESSPVIRQIGDHLLEQERKRMFDAINRIE